MEIEKNLKIELGEKLRVNEPLSQYNVLCVGGVADFFYEATSVDELIKAVAAACKNDVPYFVIGGGSNIVPSDGGFPGLVIRNGAKGFVFNGGCSEVIVDSGVPLSTLINLAAGRDLGGLEFLSGMPGTVGGAIKNCYGDGGLTINDFVKSVTLAVKQRNELLITNLPSDRLDFSAKSFNIRGTVSDHPPVILTACMQLVHRRKDEILKLIAEHWAKRKALHEVEDKAMVNFFKEDAALGMSVHQLLSSLGARKLRSGGAAVSRKYANAIINSKGAMASDVRNLAELLREAVRKKADCSLEERIEYFGKW